MECLSGEVGGEIRVQFSVCLKASLLPYLLSHFCLRCCANEMVSAHKGRQRGWFEQLFESWPFCVRFLGSAALKSPEECLNLLLRLWDDTSAL